MRKIKLTVCAILLASLFNSCKAQTQKDECNECTKTETKLTFAFLTDVHLNVDNRGNGDAGLKKAITDLQSKGASFVLFGGDNVECDRLTDETVANDLHARFKSIVDDSKVEAHYTMGNHDRFYKFEGKEDKLGHKTFEKYFGQTNVHFEKSGVHFIIISALYPLEDGSYNVNNEQIEWLKSELAKIGKESPIIVSTHIPFLSLYYPVVEGNFKPLDMIHNTKEVFEVLNDYNVKLILQGHQHIYEQIQERNRWFVTAGAVSAYWWAGEFLETQEGYLLVKVDQNNEVTWEYIDYGWTKNM
ncbi:MAG: metallophosphoesterase [Rikenellaceae bacterium]